METINEIITQSKRLIKELDKTSENYSIRLHLIANIGRTYLHNIASYIGKPYGLKTWRDNSKIAFAKEIYTKK